MIKTKFIILGLLISNIFLFTGSHAEIKTNAEESTGNGCDQILEYDDEFIETLKEDSSPENYETYNEMINQKIEECIQEMIETDLADQYESMDDLSLADYQNINENRSIVETMNEYQSYQQKKTIIKMNTEESIENRKKSDFINKTQFKQLHEGLSTMLDLANKYARGISQEKNANRNRTSRLPTLQTSCL